MTKRLVFLFSLVALLISVLFVGAPSSALAAVTITRFQGCAPGGSPCFDNKASQGDTVYLTVSGLPANASRLVVAFGNSPSGVPATIDGNDIKFTVPSGVAAGTYSSITLASDDFPDVVYGQTITVQAGTPGGPTGGAPVVEALSSCASGACPITGLTNVGDKSLTISGSNLRPLDSVLINGQLATVTDSAPDHINVDFPAGLPTGQVTVKVLSAAGQDSKTFTIAPGATPPGGTPPGATPPGGTPPQNISSDLKSECGKQGLTYDATTGLCLPGNPFNANANSLAKATSVGDLIKRILDILLTLAGVIAVLFIVIGGYSYITSRGNEKQAKSGRQTLTYAVIGLVAVLLAYTLVNVLTNLFTQGKLFGQ